MPVREKGSQYEKEQQMSKRTMEIKEKKTPSTDRFRVGNNPNVISYKTFFDKDLDYWIDYIMPHLPLSYKLHYKDRREGALRFLWYISGKFFDEICKDMIYHNTQFLFEKKGLRIMIGDRMRWCKNYEYDIATGGHSYIPFCYIGNKQLRKHSRFYYLRLQKRYTIKLHNAIRNGQEYEIIPKFDY